MEIAKRKYSNIRKLCKTEGIVFPIYRKVALFRSNISLTNQIKLIQCDGKQLLLVTLVLKSYNTTERSLKTFTEHSAQYPIEVEIADGLDGSGSHRIYNQKSTTPISQPKTFYCLLSKFFRLRIETVLYYGTTILTTQSDPILVNYRIPILSKTKHDEILSLQDLIVEKLILCREDQQGCKDCML